MLLFEGATLADAEKAAGEYILSQHLRSARIREEVVPASLETAREGVSEAHDSEEDTEAHVEEYSERYRYNPVIYRPKV